MTEAVILYKIEAMQTVQIVMGLTYIVMSYQLICEILLSPRLPLNRKNLGNNKVRELAD